MAYTIAEFKKHTRKILNEALDGPVTITRYDDKFVIMVADYVKPTTQPDLLSETPNPEPVKEPIKKHIPANHCNEHGMDKQFCINMKHKGASA